LLLRLTKKAENAPPKSGSAHLRVRARTTSALAAPVLSGILALALLFVRAPDAFTNPQFWAEDGPLFWQHQAWIGWRALFYPYAGYPVFAPRVVALVASFFDPALAPKLFAWGAILITCWSAFTAATCVDDRRIGLLLGAGLMLAPIAFGEIFGRVSHLQWIMVPTLALTLVSRYDHNKLVFATVAAFTGPFSVFLAPIAALEFCRSRSPVAAVCLAAAAVGMAFFIASLGKKSGFNLPNVALSLTDVGHIAGIMLFRSVNSVAVLGVLGAVVVLSAVMDADNRRARLAVLYIAAAILGTAVARLLTEPRALEFVNVDAGGRFFYVARVALIWCATFLFFSGPVWRRALSLAFVVAMVASGVPLQRDPMPDAHWAEKVRSGAKQIEISPPGWIVTVP
jgi:hypothetical protein